MNEQVIPLKGAVIHLADDAAAVRAYVVAAVRHNPIDYVELRPVYGGIPIAVPFADLERRTRHPGGHDVPLAELQRPMRRRDASSPPVPSL